MPASAIANPQALITAQAQAVLKNRFTAFGQTGITLYDQFIEAVKLSLTSGMHKIFSVGLVLGAVTLIVSFFLKEIYLKQDEFFEDDESIDSL